MSAAAHPSSQRHRADVVALLFGAAAAPIFWLGQLTLAYAVTAYACYPADHPVMPNFAAALTRLLIGFDIVAVIGAFAGGLVAWRCLCQAQQENSSAQLSRQIEEGRARFMARWGIFSSLCFLCAILFNIIVSVTVSPCVQ